MIDNKEYTEILKQCPICNKEHKVRFYFDSYICIHDCSYCGRYVIGKINEDTLKNDNLREYIQARYKVSNKNYICFVISEDFNSIKNTINWLKNRTLQIEEINPYTLEQNNE